MGILVRESRRHALGERVVKSSPRVYCSNLSSGFSWYPMLLMTSAAGVGTAGRGLERGTLIAGRPFQALQGRVEADVAVANILLLTLSSM